jgi:hypothetical protein
MFSHNFTRQSKQRQLAFTRTEKRETIRRYTDLERHDNSNLEAALVIASDPVSFPAESLAARWAAKVIARLQAPAEAAA